MLGCDCSTCSFNITFRFNCPPILYEGKSCYPIFPCLKEEHREYDFDYLAQLDSLFLVLINCEVTAEQLYYLQRGVGNFYQVFENLINLKGLSYFSICDQHISNEEGEVLQHCEAVEIKRVPLSLYSTVVLKSDAMEYILPRREHGLIQHTSCADKPEPGLVDPNTDTVGEDQNKLFHTFKWRVPIKRLVLKEQVVHDVNYEVRSDSDIPDGYDWTDAVQKWVIGKGVRKRPNRYLTKENVTRPRT